MMYFIHIPKCGGTTIKELFYSAIEVNRCLTVWDTRFGAMVKPDEFAGVSAEVLNFRKAIIGHLPFSTMLENKHARILYEQDKLKMVTIVRDPIDRIISLLNYVKANKNHPGHTRANQLDPFVFMFKHTENMQHKFLRVSETESIESICKRIAVFPLEDSEQGIRCWMEKATNLSIKPVEKANVTARQFPDSKPLLREELNPSQIAALEEKHFRDYELYEYSKHHNPADQYSRI